MSYKISEKLQQARDYEAREGAAIPAADRPRLHLTPRVGWMNDPNGFCHYKGAYHLFYQYYPYDTVWGPMHWGHAVSTDLLHWDYLPCAMAPDTPADEKGCFSGSAVELPDGRLALMYTGVSGTDKAVVQAQCVAVGDGVDFVKDAHNPVLPPRQQPEGFCTADFRDPKIWREGDRYYCVAAGLHREDVGSIQLYESEDALHWTFVRVLDASRDELGLMWECPDFFPLDGRQLLLVSPQSIGSCADPEIRPGYATLALVGDYDPETHRFDRRSVQLLDAGTEFYAPQTTLTPDGRRVMVAWMENWETCKGAPRRHRWFSRMTLPRELTVREGRLYQNPVREIEAHWQEEARRTLRVEGDQPLPEFSGRYQDVSLVLDAAQSPDCRALTLGFAQGGKCATTLRWEADREELVFDRSRCGTRWDMANIRRIPARARDGRLTLRLILDGDSVELFVNDGERTITSIIDTPPEADALSLHSDGPAMVELVRHTLV